jgi:hypothetical protein
MLNPSSRSLRLPAASVAVTTSWWFRSEFTESPEVNGTPSTVALTVPGWRSLAPKSIATGSAVSAPSRTPAIEICGGVKSRVKRSSIALR